MNLEINGLKFRISFQHEKDHPDKKRFERLTICTVVGHDMASGTGWCLCTIGDRFDHEKGRNKALTRALNHTNWDSDTKTQIADAWAARPRDARKPKPKPDETKLLCAECRKWVPARFLELHRGSINHKVAALRMAVRHAT